jgi:hypothetical protein
MRILPDFLIPYGVIRIDEVLKIQKVEPEVLCMDKICSLLGCVDLRTARKYIRCINVATKKASTTLAEKLANIPGKNLIPSFYPDTSFLTYFHSLVNKHNESVINLYGGRGYVLQCSCCQFISDHWPKITATYVSDSAEPPDKT